MNTTIRRATVDDAKDIADVINSVIAEEKYTIFDKPFSEERERSFISSLGSRSAMFVAEMDGKVAGIQVLDLFSDLPTSSMSHVATLGTWLRSEFRGSGIGRRLAEESVRFARDHGYRKIVIQVTDSGGKHHGPRIEDLSGTDRSVLGCNCAASNRVSPICSRSSPVQMFGRESLR